MATIKDWDEMSSCEREVFITRAAADLIYALVEERDVQGLQAIHDNLHSLTEYAEQSIFEAEISIRRNEIMADVERAYNTAKDGLIDWNLADKFREIAEMIETFSNDGGNHTEEEVLEKFALYNMREHLKQEDERFKAEFGD